MKNRLDGKFLSAWQKRFLAVLPAIVNYVTPAFRNLGVEERGEAVQAAIVNSYAAYLRLVQRGRESLAFPTVLARFAIAQVREGRQVGGRLNIQDVASPYAQRRKQFQVERLDQFDRRDGCWREAVVEDRTTPIADQVAFRIDFPQWLESLPRRDRKIAEALATGDRPSDVASQFGVSLARISQMRREFFNSWLQFHGEVDETERLELLAAA